MGGGGLLKNLQFEKKIEGKFTPLNLAPPNNPTTHHLPTHPPTHHQPTKMSTTVSITLSREALLAAIAQHEVLLAAYKAALGDVETPKKKAPKKAVAEAPATAAATATAAAAVDSDSESSARKPNKSKGVKRGSSGWNLFTAHVRAEMLAESPGTKFKVPEVTAEAKRRKEAGEYDEAHWKALALAKKESANSSDAEAPETPAKPTKPAKTEAPKKARGSPATPSLLPPTPRAAPKKAVAPPPVEDDDDEAEVSEWVFNGNKMFKSSDNEVWANKGGVPGIYLGIYDPLTNRINSYDNEKDEDEDDE